VYLFVIEKPLYYLDHFVVVVIDLIDEVVQKNWFLLYVLFYFTQYQVELILAQRQLVAALTYITFPAALGVGLSEVGE